MIKVILFSIFLLLMLLLMAGLQLMIRKLYYPIDKRYLHLRFIGAVLLLELTAFNYYAAAPIMKLLDLLINNPAVVKVMSYVLPNRSYELIYILLVTLGMNLLMLIGTLVLFLLVKIFFGERHRYFMEDEDYVGLKKLQLLPHKLVCYFYDPDEEPPALRKKGYAMGKWAGAMKWVFAVMGVLQIFVMLYSILWGKEDGNAVVNTVSKAWYWLPIGGFLLAGQIQAFLEADPSFEAGSIGSSKVTCEIRGNLSDMVKIYHSNFGETGALLSTHELKGHVEKDAGVTNEPGNLLVSECENGELLLVLCRQLKACGVDYQAVRYQRALAGLLDGKHVNICDKLEGEFFIYLTAYLNFVLSQGQTAVMLCKSSEDAQYLKKVCQHSMYRLNNIGTIWSICTAEEAARDMPMNLLICSYEELLNLRLLEIRREFAGVLKCVVIAHGEQMFAQDHIRIVRMFNELRMHSKGLQYIMLSETDNDSLRTAMENFMCDGEMVPINNATCKDHTYVMVWGEESCHRLQNRLGIGGSGSAYIGTSVPLALLAAACDIPLTHMVPAQDRPDLAYWECMCSNKLDVERYLSNHADINAVIRREPAEALTAQNLKVLICYDTQYDFLNVLWGWTKYAGDEATIIHIVSPHYLLREYFASQFDTGAINLQDKPAQALVSHSRAMEMSNMLALLVDLHDKGMTEEELLKRSREYGWSYINAERVLEACLKTILTSGETYSVYENFRFTQRQRLLDDGSGFVTETFVTLGDTEAYQRIISQIRRAVVQIGPDQRMELPILQGDISNYYLREQQLVLGGYSYKVGAVADGTIYVTQYNDSFAYEYFPVSRFGFQEYTVIDPCVDSVYLDMNIATAKVTRDSYAYWKSNNGYRIGGDGVFTLESLADGVVHEEKTVNILEINIAEAIMGDAPRNVALTLAFILKGMFKTLFPYTHQNLFAVVPGEVEDENALLERILACGAENERDDIVRSLIPVIPVDAPVREGAQVIYIVEYSCVEYGMIRLLYQNHERILRMLQDYLSWYMTRETSDRAGTEPERREDDMEEGRTEVGSMGIGHTEEGDGELHDLSEPGTGLYEPEEPGTGEETLTGRELHFGGAEIPRVLDPGTLLNILSKITGEEIRVPVEVKRPLEMDIELTNTCTFCGRSAPFMREFSDGRWMCNLCYDHQVNQREEVKELLADTMRFMEMGYGIHLRKNLNIRFKNAEEIRRETGVGMGGRVLGFYRHSGYQLWLESRGPKAPMTSTLCHELTHSWQHDNLPLNRLRKALPKAKRDELMLMLLEGHASYVEVETMHLMHEESFARRQEKMLMARDDEYGRGYRLLKDYFESKKAEGSHMNAFSIMELLVQEIIAGRVTIG